MPKIKPKQGKIENYLSYPWDDYILAQRILEVLFNRRIHSTKSIRYELLDSGYKSNRVNPVLIRLKQLGHLTEYRRLSNPEYKCIHCKKSTQYFAEKSSIDHGLKILNDNKRKQELCKKNTGFNPNDWFYCKKEYILRRFVSIICHECHKHQEINQFDDDESKLNEQYKIQKSYRYWSLSENGVFAVVGILGYKHLLNLNEWQKKNNVLRLANFLFKCHREEVVERLVNRIRNSIKIKSNVLDDVNEWYKEARDIILNSNSDHLTISKLSNYLTELKNEYDGKIIKNANKK